ncbi:hypothetical protein IKT18_02270 [Candidatus Saccharibacteria bacterium]|nr:hypothetical protein [Candidatus Saccharibacteria bacterium]
MEASDVNPRSGIIDILEFDPWQLLDWGVSILSRIEVDPSIYEYPFTAWRDDLETFEFPLPGLDDMEYPEVVTMLSKCMNSLTLLRYDLEEIYGEVAAEAIEEADQSFIMSEEKGAIYDEDPGW